MLGARDNSFHCFWQSWLSFPRAGHKSPRWQAALPLWEHSGSLRFHWFPEIRTKHGRRIWDKRHFAHPQLLPQVSQEDFYLGVTSGLSCGCVLPLWCAGTRPLKRDKLEAVEIKSFLKSLLLIIVQNKDQGSLIPCSTSNFLAFSSGLGTRRSNPYPHHPNPALLQCQLSLLPPP